jgi:formylglycine-generating enzyme required for sulfatase activity
MLMRAGKTAKICLPVISLWLFAAPTVADEIRTTTLAGQEEILPFAAVDGSGRAVTDLQKTEIVLLANGMNFRGFSLLHPAGPRAESFPELTQPPPGSYYMISFPYVWDPGQGLRIQLGTSRPGVRLAAPRSIEKRGSLAAIEDLQAEILALGLLRENTWLNMDLASLNLFAAGEGGKKAADIYQIRLPASFLGDRIDLYRITLSLDGTGVSLLRQGISPDAELLRIDRGGETYLLLADQEKAAALALKNAPPTAGTPAGLTPDEAGQVAAAIAGRRGKLDSLQKEDKQIPVELMAARDAEGAGAGGPLHHAVAGPEAPASVPAPSPLLPFPPLADVRSPALRSLESFRSALTRTANMHFCEEALKRLRQDQLAKALPLLAKSLDEPAAGNDSVAALLERLRRLERFQRETAREAKALAGTNVLKELQRLRPAQDEDLARDKGRELFAGLQEILGKARRELDLVRETLERMPEQMGQPEAPSPAGNGIAAAGTPELAARIERYLSAAAEIAGKTFIARAWTLGVMSDLRRVLAQYSQRVEAVKQRLVLLPESLSGPATRFVMANSRIFGREFKRSFYETTLPGLGVAPAMLDDPAFADAIIQALALEKNAQGFWEASFDDELTMIYIPPGSFTMGVPWESGGAQDESPPHRVELDGYWIARDEATFSQFDRFCQATGRPLPSDFGKGRRKHPVIGISYQDALAYCQWLSGREGVRFRLPSEAEWEGAARGPDGRMYPWGNSAPDGSLANFADANFLEYYQKADPPASEAERQQMRQWIAAAADDGYIFTAPVGSFPRGASPCGAMDMAGNVWEWVADWYDGNYYQGSPAQNPPGSPSGTYRVVRGGGWDCNPWMLRSTTRSGAPPLPGKGSESVGFRVAASPPPATPR